MHLLLHDLVHQSTLDFNTKHHVLFLEFHFYLELSGICPNVRNLCKTETSVNAYDTYDDDDNMALLTKLSVI